MYLRKTITTLHLVSGLVASLVLVVLGLTGALITFEPQIEGALHPSLYDVQVRGQPLTLTILDAKVASALQPTESLGTCLFPARANQSFGFTIFRSKGLPRQIFVNQYTGQILGTLSVVRFTLIVRQLHVLAGLWGCSTLCLMFLLLTGLYLWVPLKRIGISSQARGHRFFFDVHNSVGILSSTFLFLFAATGTYMALYPIISSRSHLKLDQLTTPNTLSSDPKGAQPLSADDAVSLARHLLSGATPIWVNFPQRGTSLYMVKMRFPEDRSFNGSSAVWLDQFSGRPTSIWNSRTDSLGGKLNRLSREAHTGDSLGYSGRLVACLMSLTLILQTMTGIGMWWKTRAANFPYPRPKQRS
jgi:uncharacterized iron-regulated membrane protein